MEILSINSVCGTILDQLGGGRRLEVMCGASRIVADEEARSVTFKIGKSGANIVKIILEHDDTYTLQLIRQNSYKVYCTTGKLFVVSKEFTGVYAEDLRADFTLLTGMELSL